VSLSYDQILRHVADIMKNKGDSEALSVAVVYRDNLGLDASKLLAAARELNGRAPRLVPAGG
jgi:hypothetical protein